MAINYHYKIREIEAQLEKARASQDGKEYAEICNKSGIDPYDRELYEQGMAEILNSRNRSENQHQKKKSNYQEFYKR